MLSGGTQRRALPRYQSQEMTILYKSFPRVEIESIAFRVYSRILVPLCYDWHQVIV